MRFSSAAHTTRYRKFATYTRPLLAGVLFVALLLVASPGVSPAQETQEENVNAAPERPSFEYPEDPEQEFVPGRLLVKARSEESNDDIEQANRRLGARTEEEFPELDIKLVEFDSSRPVEKVAAAYEQDPDVEYAVPDRIRHPAALTPNDPLFTRQWNLHNTGQGRTAGAVDADIDAPEAWSTATGSASTVVAVMDTGVNITHPDLEGRIWTNPGETANGVDDDGNGLIDDLNGWDFFNGNNSVYDGVEGEEHGTHVAGTIAATAGNGRGVSGVAPGVKIMPLKVCGMSDGAVICPSSAMIDAFDYAASKGVKVVNASLGGAVSSDPERQAIARAGASGTLFTFPSGNGGADGVGDDNDATPFYPASYANDNIISVAASDTRDDLADFSNYGASSVDLAAPGVGVLSTGMPRPDRAPVAVRVAGSSTYTGFGLEQIAGAANRDDFLSKALAELGSTPSAPILLVDDDGGGSHETYYETSLGSLGFTDVTRTTVAAGADGPDTTAMDGKVVIWSTGAAYSDTLTATDQEVLTTHLNGGGKLLLMGQDIGYDIGGGRPASSPTTFYSQRLGATLLDDNFNPAAVGGNGAGSFASGDRYELFGGDGATYDRYVDRLGYSATASTSLLSVEEDETYAVMSGTSMAAPHVAGVAALLRSRAPSLNPDAVKATILDTAEKKPAFDGKSATGGRLNAARALVALPAPPPQKTLPNSTRLTLTASPKLVGYNGRTFLSGRLSAPGGPVAGKSVEVWRSTDGGRRWKRDGTASYDRASGNYKAGRRLTANTTFQFRFAGAPSYKASRSPQVAVRARAYLSRPKMPSKVKKGAAFRVSGYLKPRHPGKTRLDFYQYRNGKWRFYRAVKARNGSFRGHTRYVRRYRLPRPGKWKVMARHADDNHAATKSPPKHFRVRR